MSRMSTPDPSVPAGWVTITPNQVYDELRATHNLLGEMRADIREVLRRMEANTAQVGDHEIRLRGVESQGHQNAERVAEVAADSIDHEVRLRKVEMKIWIAAGFAASGGGAVGAIAMKLLGG